MNHQKIYESIIQKAKSENRVKLRKNNLSYIYYENHHIVPKCLNGNDEKDNKVLLTAKEHFICHKLLTYIYKENLGIIRAFHLISYHNTYKKYVSAKDYAYIKELFSLTEMPIETKQKISKSLSISVSGEKNGMFGRHHSQKSIQKIKKNLDTKKEKNPMFEHIYTDNTLQQMSISQKNRTKLRCPICKKLVDPGNFGKWHGSKCRYLDIKKDKLVCKDHQA